MNLQIERVLALPATVTPSTMYIVRAADAELAELYFTNDDGSATRRIITKEDVQDLITSMVPESADKLTTARHITATGDASWDVLFDGSADATAVLTLAASGVSAGEYPVVTVDAKGRVTAARALTASDIPSIPGSKINSDISVNTTGNAATATSAAALTTPRLINGEAFDGTADITISAVDTATPRIAESEKGQANGVATLDSAGKVPASQLPGFVDDVQEFADFAALPATGEAGIIYITLDNNFTYRWGGTVYIAIPGGAGTADTALKLHTARSISITGDGSWTVNFDGSANVSAAFTLANSGVTAGEYAVVTVDAKGRATAGRDLVEADLPDDITSAKVLSARSITLGASEW